MLSKTRCMLLGAFVALMFGCAQTHAEDAPQVVFKWDARAWLEKRNPQQFNGEPITNPDGTEGVRASVTERSSQNPWNHIFVTRANLEGGKDYTAAVTFSVVEPTKFPNTFYLYARNSAGNQHDLWANWVGLPGETRTITLPLSLKKIEGGQWTLTLGIGKSGSIDVHNVVVYSGTTSDGKTAFRLTPPVANATAPAKLPEGVSPATGYTDFALAPPAAPIKTISPVDYGFVADAPGADVAQANAVALQKAIDACKSAGASTLSIPKGVYRVSTARAIVFDGFKDFTFDGNGSTLIFEKLSKDGPAILMKDCQRLAMLNVTFDWNWDDIPIASLGVVSNLSADRLQCDITFPDLNAAQTALTARTPWRGMMAIDPTTLYRTDINIVQVAKETKIEPGNAPNVLHVTFPKAVPLAEGQSYCIRHLYYEMAGFKIAESSDVSFRNVDMLSMPGMGWFFSGGMRNFELVDCDIRRAEGTRHPLTTAADGFHANQFVSNFRVLNCSVTGAGDDAMNFHTEAYQGTLVPDANDPKTLTLLDSPSYHLRLRAGDPVEFYNSDFTPLGGVTPVTRIVSSVKSDNAGKPATTTVQFTEPVPPGVTAQSILMNARFETSNVLIKGCRMIQTNGRGILISAKNATIEDNVFDQVYGSGINVESDLKPPLWSEGRGVSNLLIRNNVFKDCNQQVRYNGAIIYANTRMPYGQTTATLFDRVTIEKNKFVNLAGHVLWLTNASNLIVRDNEIGPVTGASPSAGTLLLETTKHAAVGGNTWIAPANNEPVGGVVVDPATTSKVSTDGNTIAPKK